MNKDKPGPRIIMIMLATDVTLDIIFFSATDSRRAMHSFLFGLDRFKGIFLDKVVKWWQGAGVQKKTWCRNGSMSPVENWFIDSLLSQVREAELREVWLAAGGLEVSAGCPACGLDGFWNWNTHSLILVIASNSWDAARANVNQAVKKRFRLILASFSIKSGMACARHLVERSTQPNDFER